MRSNSFNFRESTDRSLDKEFVGPDEDGNASTDDEDATEDEAQGSRAKKAKKSAKEPAEEAPCLYCGRVFKGDKGVQRHERFCQKKKEMMG